MTSGRRAGYALLAFAAVLFVVAAIGGWRGAERITAREDQARAVEGAAAEFVLAYGTFDHRTPTAYTARLIDLTAGVLHDALASSAVDPDAARLQRAITTHIEATAATALSPTEATAVVTAVQERRWTDPAFGDERSESVRQRITCRLVREEGRWLVAEMRLEAEGPASANGR